MQRKLSKKMVSCKYQIKVNSKCAYPMYGILSYAVWNYINPLQIINIS